jgi:hypothetical protein
LLGFQQQRRWWVGRACLELHRLDLLLHLSLLLLLLLLLMLVAIERQRVNFAPPRLLAT